MSATTTTHEAAVVADLQQRLRGELDDPDLTVGTLVRFGDGHSGVTYALELQKGDGEIRRAVLRLSPAGLRIAGPADVGRQGRIMAALHERGLPAPRVIACDSAPVLDGRAFALMELVEGDGWEAVAARRSNRHVAEEAVAVLRRMQALPLRATGIGDETPASPEAELARWARLLEGVPAEARAHGAPLREMLAAEVPSRSAPVLVHGDFHYGNLLFAGGRVAAVFDWEIAQLGDPLLDVGCLAVAALRRRYAPDPNPTGSVTVDASELVALVGADPDRAAWFVALSCFKYGAIIAYNLALHRSGKRPDAMYEQLQRTMLGLLADGRTILADGLDAPIFDGGATHGL